MPESSYFEKLKNKMDTYVHVVYKATKSFPKDEIYGLTSQFRRATLSVILNFIEGYARMRDKVQQNFFEISYGSLQESKYLLEFSYKEGYLNKSDFDQAMPLANEIGAMLWTIRNKANN